MSIRIPTKINPIADKEQRQQRLSKCLACPYMDNNKCSKCGCLLKAKIALKRAICPINNW